MIKLRDFRTEWVNSMWLKFNWLKPLRQKCARITQIIVMFTRTFGSINYLFDAEYNLFILEFRREEYFG